MDRAEIRQQARAQLGGNIFGTPWLMAVVVCLIFAAAEGVVGSIVAGLGSILVVGPMSYGMGKLFLQQAAEGTEIKVEKIFDGFRDDFGNIFLIGLMTSLFTFLWSLLLFVPGIMKAYGWSQAYFIKVDHPDYEWKACMDESARMMTGHKWELFLLDLSFFGWYIVGGLCLGIGSLWVNAYHNAARAQYYLDLTAYQVL